MRAVTTSASQVSKEVKVNVSADSPITGDVVVPAGAKGIVVFAHGSGSGRFRSTHTHLPVSTAANSPACRCSSRNRYVAKELQSAGLATALFDLLTAKLVVLGLLCEGTPT